MFFDRMRWAWRYEIDGYEVTYRITHREGTFIYLPDFWLPDLNVFVEVKGSWNKDECLDFLDAAAHLSSGGQGGCNWPTYPDVIVAGPVENYYLNDNIRVFSGLHMHKGDLVAYPFNSSFSSRFGGCRGLGEYPIVADYGGDEFSITQNAQLFGIIPGHWAGAPLTYISKWLLHGMSLKYADLSPRAIYRITNAYEAALSARFEHGESG